MENGYLKLCTPPASDGGGLTESAFSASSAEFFGTGSLLLLSFFAFCAESCCPAALLAANIPAAARAAEPAPRKPRRVQRSFSNSSAMRNTSLDVTRRSHSCRVARYPTSIVAAIQSQDS